MAKTQEANKALSLAFQSREVGKLYLALTHKKTSKKQGVVIGDMEKARGGSFKLARTKGNPARTAFYSYGLGDGSRLIVLKPYTGKTHQLRVALKSLSAPIIGDERYGGVESDRMYLHAYQLQFLFNGKEHCYCELPKEGELFQSENILNVLKRIDPLQKLSWPK